jgi:hypothetical protein
VYAVTEAQLEAGLDAVACSLCSLRIRVLFAAVPPAHPTS